MGLLWLLVFPVLVWGLPGLLASRWVLPRATALERFATSALFGASTVVPLAYVVPYVLRRPITATWILIVSAALAAFFALLQWRWPRAAEAALETPGHRTSQDRWTVVGVVLLVAASALTCMPRSLESIEFFSPCPHQASMYLLEDGTGAGLETWDAQWERRVAHVTEHAAEPGYGLAKILTVQRIGSAATLVEHFVFHGSGGLPVASLTYYGIVGLFTALLLSLSLRSRGLVLLLTFVALMAYRLGGAYMVNENLLAASLSTGLFWLVMRHRFGSPGGPPDARVLALAALVYAHAVATRPELGLILPAVLWAAAPWTARRLVLIGALAAVAMVPWLLTNYESFGEALYHPSLHRGRTVIEFFGMKVLFHPLNWPLGDAFVRPDSDPFPNLLMLPLRNLRDFGVPFVALALVGAARVGWRRLALLTAWTLPNYLILLMIVNLDRDKLSYCVMSFFPVTYLAGVGLGWCLERPFARRAKIALGVALSAVLLLPQALRGLELPVDPRRQFNESREERDFDPIEDKRDELLRPVLFGVPDPYDARQGWLWSWSLLWNGRPVHRTGGPADGVVHFWCEQIPLTKTVEIATMAAPDLPPYVADPNDFELTKNYVPFSIEVRAAAPTVTVTLARTSSLDVSVTTSGGPGPARYVTLALLDDGVQPIDGISLTIDGQRVPVDVLVVERADRPEKPALVANHPWRYTQVPEDRPGREEGERLLLVPEPWPMAACPVDPKGDIVFGPLALLDRREGHRRPPIRIRVSRGYPPAPMLACPALSLDSGRDGEPGAAGHER